MNENHERSLYNLNWIIYGSQENILKKTTKVEAYYVQTIAYQLDREDIESR